MTDAIRLTIPREKPYYGVARLVVGGLAARLDLSYEYLEDLQLALESLLSETYGGGADVTVEFTVDAEAVAMLVGPLDAGKVRPDLERDLDESEGVGLRRLLATVVEDARLERVGDTDWLRLEKRIPRGAAS